MEGIVQLYDETEVISATACDSCEGSGCEGQDCDSGCDCMCQWEG